MSQSNKFAIARRSCLVGVLFGILIVFSGCGDNSTGPAPNDKAPPQLEVIRAAYVPAGYYLPFVVAKEQKLFEKRGYRIELLRYQDNSQMVNLFLNGHLDVTAQSSFTMFPTEVEHPGLLKFVYGQFTNSYYFIVPSDSSIQALTDLKGKTIGTWKSPTAVNYITLVLERAGLKEGDYSIQRFGATEWPAALENGVVDAAFGFDVLLARLAMTTDHRYLADDAIQELAADQMLFNGGAFVSTKLIENDPAKAKAIRDVLLEAVEIIRTNEELTAQIAAKTLLPDQIPLDERVKIAKSAKFDVFTKPDDELTESAKQTLDLLIDKGTVSKRIDVLNLFWAPEKQDEVKKAA